MEAAATTRENTLRGVMSNTHEPASPGLHGRSSHSDEIQRIQSYVSHVRPVLYYLLDECMKGLPSFWRSYSWSRPKSDDSTDYWSCRATTSRSRTEEESHEDCWVVEPTVESLIRAVEEEVHMHEHCLEEIIENARAAREAMEQRLEEEARAIVGLPISAPERLEFDAREIEEHKEWRRVWTYWWDQEKLVHETNLCDIRE